MGGGESCRADLRILRGVGRNSSRGLGSSKRQVRGNFPDKQKRTLGGKPPTPLGSATEL